MHLAGLRCACVRCKLLSPAQRIREQIRSWASDATIRDTSLLIEARRAIEHQMVRASSIAPKHAVLSSASL